MVLFPVMGFLEVSLHDQLQSVVQPPPAVVEPSRYSHRSIETLVVVLAVITIVGVIAGVIARLCGGRHGEHDIEGWVERRCRSCIDGGVPPPAEEAKPATEEAKK